MSRRFTGEAVSGMTAILIASAGSAHATYSIIACDEKTRQRGVAVETNNLAVGASVPYAQAGVGALVSQFEINPHYGPRGLAVLTQGASPEETLKRSLADATGILMEKGQKRATGKRRRANGYLHRRSRTARGVGGRMFRLRLQYPR
jgi:hypothetical protein